MRKEIKHNGKIKENVRKNSTTYQRIKILNTKNTIERQKLEQTIIIKYVTFLVCRYAQRSPHFLLHPYLNGLQKKFNIGQISVFYLDLKSNQIIYIYIYIVIDKKTIVLNPARPEVLAIAKWKTLNKKKFNNFIYIFFLKF